MPEAWTSQTWRLPCTLGMFGQNFAACPPSHITNNNMGMLRGSSPVLDDGIPGIYEPTTRVPLARQLPEPRAANQRQRTRSRSPRRDYRDRSRSRSRDNYRSRRERSPANGHYESGSYSERSRDRPAPNKEQIVTSMRENSQQERRVYVGNLSYDVKWHHLKDFMRQGECPIPTPILHVRRRRDTDQQHSR